MCWLVIDECDTPNDVTRRVKPEKCFWKAGILDSSTMDIVRRILSGSRWASGRFRVSWWYNQWLGQLYARGVCQLGLLSGIGSIVKTSEKRPTSLQGPKDLFPMRSLFGGFTVVAKFPKQEYGIDRTHQPMNIIIIIVIMMCSERWVVFFAFVRRSSGNGIIATAIYHSSTSEKRAIGFFTRGVLPLQLPILIACVT